MAIQIQAEALGNQATEVRIQIPDASELQDGNVDPADHVDSESEMECPVAEKLLRQLFDAYDVDKNGSISRDELLSMLQASAWVEAHGARGWPVGLTIPAE